MGGIPEDQLETWAKPGAGVGSRDTYATIKTALESSRARYANQPYSIFLQGSYGNATNIRTESDVDVIIRLDSCVFYDTEELSQGERDNLNSSFSDAEYPYPTFKSDVGTRLKTAFGDDAVPGSKAIAVAANGNRRKSDVIAAAQFRRYWKYNSVSDSSYTEGICFYTASGEQIVNYPSLHADNLTTKNKDTNGMFKPMVRILKNMRTKLVADGIIKAGVAPSYYIEGLLHNVPPDKFLSNYEDTFVAALTWLQETDRSDFECAHGQYYLLRNDPHVTWRADHCRQFLEAVIGMWNNW